MLHEKQATLLKQAVREAEAATLRGATLGALPAAESSADVSVNLQARAREVIVICGLRIWPRPGPQYLKNVIVKYMATVDASERRRMLPAISTLLKLTCVCCARACGNTFYVACSRADVAKIELAVASTETSYLEAASSGLISWFTPSPASRG